MNFSEDEGSVRASLFRPSGKWYEDIAVDMNAFYKEPDIFDAVRKAVEKSKKIETGWMVVILEPYHCHSHPIMIIGK